MLVTSYKLPQAPKPGWGEREQDKGTEVGGWTHNTLLPTCAKLIEVKDGGFLVPAEHVGWWVLDALKLLGQGPEDLALLQAGGEELAGTLLQLQPRAAQQLLSEKPLLAVSQLGGAGEAHQAPGAQGHRWVGGLVCQQALAAPHLFLVAELPPVVDADVQDGDDAICTRQRSAAAFPKPKCYPSPKCPLCINNY